MPNTKSIEPRLDPCQIKGDNLGSDLKVSLKPHSEEAAHAIIKGKKMSKSEKLLSFVFLTKSREGETTVPFSLEDLEIAAGKLDVTRPKNLPDTIYSLQKKGKLPAPISETADEGFEWQIENTGGGSYCFRLAETCRILPDLQTPPVEVDDVSQEIADQFDLTNSGRLDLQLRMNGLLNEFVASELTLVSQPVRGFVKHVGQIDIDALYAAKGKGGQNVLVPVLIEPTMKTRFGTEAIPRSTLYRRHIS